MTSDTRGAGMQGAQPSGRSTTTARPGGRLAVLGWVTTTGVVVFLVSTIVVHLVRSDLDPVVDPASLYALGAAGWLWATALVAVGLAGLSVVASAEGLSVVGRASLAIWAVGSFTAAAFPMDAPGAPTTTTGAIHEYVGFNFVFAIIAALLLGRSLRRADRRDPWARRARIGAWLLAISGISLVVFMGVLHSLDLGDLAQRVYWALLLGWLIVMQLAIAAGTAPIAPRARA
jgi:hypothetical protein